MSGELLGFGAFLFLVASFAIWHNRNTIREWLAREPVSLDALDTPQTHRPADASTGSAGRCPNCRRQSTGLVWVLVAEHLGGGLDRVCHGCADEGMRKGWFRASLERDATVYDVAVANACHDLDDIEAYANGEAS